VQESPYHQHGPDSVRWWHSSLTGLIGGGPGKLRHPVAVEHVASWLAAGCASGPVIGECLDALEASLAAVPRPMLAAPPPGPETSPNGFRINPVDAPWSIGSRDWRHGLRQHPWLSLLRGLLRTRPGLFSPDQITRWYRLMRWVEQPYRDARPLPVEDRLLIAAHEAGAASVGDVVASFRYPRSVLFRDLTRHWGNQARARRPALTVLADQVRDQLIATELQRGDRPRRPRKPP